MARAYPEISSVQGSVRQGAIHLCRVVLVVGVVNLVGALTKLIARELTRSVGMSADGLHAALDVLASGIAQVGIRLAARPPDPRHPYVYERYESVAAMEIGGFLVLAFMRILGEALSRLWRPEAVEVPWSSVAIMAGSMLANGWLSWWEHRQGRALGSDLLQADAAHTGSDVLASLAVLRGTVLLGLLPHALERAPMLPTLGTVLDGLVLFFGLEKVVLWRHCHDRACDIHKAAGPLILLGDALHNFVDGVVIAAAFLAAVPLGIVSAIALIAHEVPQEVGDFAMLLESGYTRLRALALNGLSSLATLLGAILGWLALDVIQGTIPAILALSAASFLYIATADLIPHLHQRLGPASSRSQGLGLLAGIGTILLVRLYH